MILFWKLSSVSHDFGPSLGSSLIYVVLFDSIMISFSKTILVINCFMFNSLLIKSFQDFVYEMCLFKTKFLPLSLYHMLAVVVAWQPVECRMETLSKKLNLMYLVSFIYDHIV